MRRIRGTKSLVHDAVDATVDLVELGHESTARTVMRVLSQSKRLAKPAHHVNEVRRVVTGGILGTVKGVNRAVEAVTNAAWDFAAPDVQGRPALVPMRSDLMTTPAVATDAAIGAINGAVGDHLAREANGLDLGMHLRSLDAWIEADGFGIPGAATGHIVVLVHGLSATEWSWCLDAERQLGDATANFGTLLQQDLGFTPIFARYNSGKHISENGRMFAAHLERLVATWPVPVQELVLLGHSMGGLVSRSACHLGHTEQKPWVNLVSRVVTLSSPLQGAPLEKFANLAAAALSAVDLPATAISGQILKGRSAGIKDLRHGYVHDSEWQGQNPDGFEENRQLDLALPAHISWCFISATLTKSAKNPVSQAVGDLLVRVESSAGPVDTPVQVTNHHVGGIHHAAVQVSPEVYALVRDFLAGQPSANARDFPSGMRSL